MEGLGGGRGGGERLVGYRVGLFFRNFINHKRIRVISKVPKGGRLLSRSRGRSGNFIKERQLSSQKKIIS